MMKRTISIMIFTMTVLTSCNENRSSEVSESPQITMNLYYTGTDGNARRFVEEMESSGTADAIRNEEGNVRYDYFISLSDPETVLLIDSWVDQKALDAHHETPMMQTIIDLREKYDLRMTAERYIQDVQGIPQADQAYIRE